MGSQGIQYDMGTNMQEQVLMYLQPLHYLLFQRAENGFVAHCLNLDLVVSGPTMEDASRRLDELVVFHVENILFGGRYQDAFTPAPQEYWDRFTASKELANGSKLVIRVPRLDRPVDAESEYETVMPGIIQAMIASQQNVLPGPA